MLSFNGNTKEITITTDTELNVLNLWSRWLDWYLTGDNSKYAPAMAQVGGDDIDPIAGTSVPIYIFLLNGWKVKPKEANHTLNVTQGILLVYGGGDPFVNPAGAFTVRINYQQPVQALTVSTGGGSGSAPTVEQIADEIMSRDIATESNVNDKHALVMAALAALNVDVDGVATSVVEVLKHTKNRWKIAANQLTVYDDDGITPLQVYNLKDASGAATMTEPYERDPV